MQAYPNLNWRVDGGVGYLEIDRRPKRNALTNKMYEGIAGTLHEADRVEDVRCIVIRGIGGIFTAGSDVSEFLDKSIADREAHFDHVAQLLLAPARISKPVVAAVDGLALGGGTGLVSACDLVLASEDAVFGIPEIHVGIWPCTLLPMLARAVGPRRAYEMALLGERMDAEQARAAGLVTRVVPKERLEAELARWTAQIVAASPQTVRTGKRACREAEGLEVEKATFFMARQMAINSASKDAMEGISAFLFKRPPRTGGP